MKSRPFRWLMVALVAGVLLYTVWTATDRSGRLAAQVKTDPVADNARLLLEEGRRVFRYETFGDEAFWGDTLKLHQAIAGAKLGGVGPAVSPKTALSVGLKVDVEHYNQFLKLNLTDAEKRDLIEYLKSL